MVLGVLLAGALLVGIGVITAQLWPNASAPGNQSEPSGDATPTPTEVAATVQSSSKVTIEGGTVVVEEVSTVVDGDRARAIPAQTTPLGLQLIDSSVVTPDGRTFTFDSPLALEASGSLTLRSRYRLTECPDILPTQWPSPAEFPDATRSYVRLDGPLHTAYAICPGTKPAAQKLPGLLGTAVGGSPTRVRLSWAGSPSITVTAIGAASGVAAVVANPVCDASCVATLPPGGSAVLQLQPVDPCPPATDSTRLTLVVEGDDGSSTIAVDVDGLANAICS